MDTCASPEKTSRGSMRMWLFNPFHRVAGGKALALGIVSLLAAALLGSLGNAHFDGVLDFHQGPSAPVGLYVCEGLVDWLALSIPLLLTGKLILRSRGRIVDVLGTQALARFPSVLTAGLALLPPHRRIIQQLTSGQVQNLRDLQAQPPDMIVFAMVVLVIILMTIWMVALMYRAFSVSCNLRGGKAIGVFIGALIAGEVISKVAFLAIHSH